jgi:hypothetical protein
VPEGATAKRRWSEKAAEAVVSVKAVKCRTRRGSSEIIRGPYADVQYAHRKLAGRCPTVGVGARGCFERSYQRDAGRNLPAWGLADGGVSGSGGRLTRSSRSPSRPGGDGETEGTGFMPAFGGGIGWGDSERAVAGTDNGGRSRTARS